MIGLTIHESFITIFLIYIQFELLIYICYQQLWVINLQTTERNLIKKKIESSFQQTNFFWVWSILLILITYKILNYNIFTALNVFIAVLFLNIFVTLSLTSQINCISSSQFKYFNFIGQILFMIIFWLSFTKSLLSLFFLLELISTCYYFFLMSLSSTAATTKFNRFKNLLLLYLWNSFWTSILFGIMLISFLYTQGTLDYNQLFLTQHYLWVYNAYLLLISIGLKLGMPGAHFFKLQIYAELDSKLIFFYSTVTVFINIFILVILIQVPLVVSFLQKFTIIWYFFFFGVLVFIYFFLHWNLINFFIYSVVTTLFTILLLLM